VVQISFQRLSGWKKSRIAGCGLKNYKLVGK
jgi:hypothetical protein